MAIWGFILSAWSAYLPRPRTLLARPRPWRPSPPPKSDGVSWFHGRTQWSSNKKNMGFYPPCDSGWWLGHPYEKYDFVNWDDYINPILMGKYKKWQPNHQHVISLDIWRFPESWGTPNSWMVCKGKSQKWMFGGYPYFRQHGNMVLQCS